MFGFFFPQKGLTDWFNTWVHENIILMGKFTVSDKTVSEEEKPKYYIVLYGEINL